MNPTGKSFPGKASTRFPHGFRRAPRSCRRRRAAADRPAALVAELAATAGRDPKDFLVEVSGTPRVVSPQMLGDTWNHGESAERYPVDTGRLRRVVRSSLHARPAGDAPEFLINRKIATVLGLTIPPALLMRADQVVQ